MRKWLLALIIMILAPFSLGLPAHALSQPFAPSLTAETIIIIAIIAAIVVVCLLMLVRARSVRRQQHTIIGDLQQKQHRLEEQLYAFKTLVSISSQQVLIWTDQRQQPYLMGTLAQGEMTPQNVEDFLRFNHWLKTQSAHAIQQALDHLLQQGQDFALNIETKAGELLNAVGRVSGAQAIVSLSTPKDDEMALVNLQKSNRDLDAQLTTFQQLLDQIDHPVWVRNHEGAYIWTNHAYFDAVESEERDLSALKHDLLNDQTLKNIHTAHQNGQSYHGRQTAIVAGARHSFAILDLPTSIGSAGIAFDYSKTEDLQQKLNQLIEGYAQTLDQLSTAVAIFTADRKLQFFNHAFAVLWGLDRHFLESHPSHSLLLDHLREQGKLAQQSDWRAWKEELFQTYHENSSREQSWYLPDGRTLRVVTNPYLQGGVIWLFENLTEQIDLESRYNTLIKVQGETLDHLSEGVAVFGADGLLRLFNPAFAQMWSMPDTLMQTQTHISQIQAWCDDLSLEQPWAQLSAAVTGIGAHRSHFSGRIDMRNGKILDYALVPLPKGQIMLTFVDVTDSVNVERALKDKNEALEFADNLRNAFIQHVSYQLRSPLTNIIGFSEMLQTPDLGALNMRQQEYLGYIESQSHELLNLVNDILDLATVDAGIMELDIDRVDVGEVMESAVERVADLFEARAIKLDVAHSVTADIFEADRGRVRQVLINLLKNAANFAPQYSQVDFYASCDGDDIIFRVSDQGAGIDPDSLNKIFQRFQSEAHNGGKSGAGLGLSIVKSFVELHGGTVTIKSEMQKGTTVLCRFPRQMPHFSPQQNKDQ